LGFAVVLLFEAWMIGAVCRDLATADYLVALLSGWLPPILLPLLLFAAASAVSFATGSSWSTMSILLPNVVALAASLGEQTQLGVIGMVAISIGAVLDGAIFGDHCSPISDTTVLSSVASGSDHLDHVRTQAPYAFTTGALAVTCGYLPSVLLDWWSLPLALACGAALIAVLLFGLGRRLPDAESGG
jgi:Na+/H+ antiporter NhaC